MIWRWCMAAPVMTLTVTHAAASRHTISMIRRARSVRPAHRRGTRPRRRLADRTSSAGGPEDIAGTPHGMDHRLATGVDLLTQVGDVELDDVDLAAEVVVPDPVEDLELAQDPTGVAHEEAQQLVLRGGQRDQLASAAYLPAVLVEGQIPDHQRSGLRPGHGSR